MEQDPNYHDLIPRTLLRIEINNRTVLTILHPTNNIKYQFYYHRKLEDNTY